jgi:hypothetical protein
MSYTSNVKGEISNIETDSECCRKALLAAFIRLEGKFALQKNGYYTLTLTTENNSEARWFIFAMNSMFDLHSGISMGKNKLSKNTVFNVKVEGSYASSVAYSALGLMDITKNGYGIFNDLYETVAKDCCRLSYYRGAFLASGIIKDPDRGYNIEIGSKNEEEINRLYELLKKEENLNAKKSRRRNNPFIYFNGGDDIATFLSMIGAHKMLMDYENKRIVKSLMNDTNRMANCDEYNSDRSVDTKFRQVNAIEYIKRTRGLDYLNEKLQETARLRLNEDLGDYNEIAEAMSVKVSKSTVQKRLAKIEEIAEKLGYKVGKYE